MWAINNGIQCARFDGMLEDPGAVKGSYGIGVMDPVVLFVGRMVGGMKGGDILMEAVPDSLQSHGDAKVIFVGEGDNKMHCDHRSKELNVEGSCRFLGSRSGEELVNLPLAQRVIETCLDSKLRGLRSRTVWWCPAGMNHLA